MSLELNIVADENIPFVAEAFATLGRVHTLAGRSITPQAVRDADVLLVRSITRVDDSLLAESAVRFLATATIGTDHIDEECLSSRGIGFASAPGSNSNSVAEYVTAALLYWAERRDLELAKLTLGVVGIGHVGSKVVARARALGMNVLCNDPPLKRSGQHPDFVELADLLGQTDAVTFHVPLQIAGEDPTMHMIDANVLDRFSAGKDTCLLINSSRGGVHDTAALLAAQDSRRAQALPPVDLVLDVWENEPNIDVSLMEAALLATPHIAGYSFDGKLAGTMMIYRAACEHFDVAASWQPPDDLPEPAHPVIQIESAGLSPQQIARLAVRHAYDIEWDDAALRLITDHAPEAQGAYFDRLRKQYPPRREFPAGAVRVVGAEPHTIDVLTGLGFKLID